jgi:TonB family protein
MMSGAWRTLAAACFLLLAVAVPGAQDPDAQRPGNGVTAPRLLREVKPQYTPEARAAGIEGEVLMEAVVRSDGAVGDVRVVKSLDAKYGLDEQAVKAAGQWLFEPGTRDGKPVPCSSPSRWRSPSTRR